jgi:hypothetical protein
VTVEDFPGVEAAGHAAADGHVAFCAPAPPPLEAAIVVAAREGGRVLLRAPVPRSLDPEHPAEICVPDMGRVSDEGESEAKGSK